jgi:hypothetical protein
MTEAAACGAANSPSGPCRSSDLPVALTIWRRVSRCHGAGVIVVPGRLSRWPGDVLSGAGLVSQACVTCLDDGLCPVGDLQLGQDVGHVVADRLLPIDSGPRSAGLGPVAGPLQGTGWSRPASPETFARKRDARAWLVRKEAEILASDWLNPDGGKVPLGEFATAWVRAQHNRERAGPAGRDGEVQHPVAVQPPQHLDGQVRELAGQPHRGHSPRRRSPGWAGQTADLPLFRITDHRIGPATEV